MTQHCMVGLIRPMQLYFIHFTLYRASYSNKKLIYIFFSNNIFVCSPDNDCLLSKHVVRRSEKQLQVFSELRSF
jgi:hypothetical protein